MDPSFSPGEPLAAFFPFDHGSDPWQPPKDLLPMAAANGPDPSPRPTGVHVNRGNLRSAPGDPVDASPREPQPEREMDWLTGVCGCSERSTAHRNSLSTDNPRPREHINGTDRRGKQRLFADVDPVERVNDGSTPDATLRIVRTGNLEKPLRLPVKKIGGSADAGDDFNRKALDQSSVYFASGQKVARLNIPLQPTESRQREEELNLQLGGGRDGEKPMIEASIPLSPTPKLGSWGFTMGTSIEIHNHTGKDIYYRGNNPYYGWDNTPSTLQPGRSMRISRDYAAFDDIEGRIFADYAAAAANDSVRSIELQAENPAWSAPWIEYSNHTEYFQNQGEEHSVTEPCTWRDTNSWWWKRENDGNGHKNFQLHIKRLVILNNGEHKSCTSIDW
jgi:hypothetical protein